MMSVLMCPKLGSCCDAGMMLTDEKIKREREREKEKQDFNFKVFIQKERRERTLDQSRVTPV